MNRRHFVLGISNFGLIMLSGTTAESSTAGTVFNITWRDLNIGYSKVNITRNGSQIVARTEVLIKVNILGIDLFDYKLNSKEIWRNKALFSLDSEVFTAGKREFSSVKRKSQNSFEIFGSGFKGIFSGNPGTTSYFTPHFLERDVWISTQNGKPLNVEVKKVGPQSINTPNGTIEAMKWSITGDLQLNLFYDNNDEWVGSDFRAGGSKAQFVLHKKVGMINQIWAST
ncbi:MAG: DUF6134 family protein [Pseudomonadota bacterium]|nr:DUF6134 family protein [Pseudomonadota bacterium]